MKKPKHNLISKGLQNRRARFDYNLGESVVAGIMLSGPETRCIRSGRVTLTGSFVSVKDGELWLNNMLISPTVQTVSHMPEPTRTRARKLLVTSRQLSDMITAKQQGKSIIPTEIITGRYIKVRIAIGTGKKKYDKRETIKKRDLERELKRRIK